MSRFRNCFRSLLICYFVACCTGLAAGQQPAAGIDAIAVSVDAQPLLSQVRRVAKAMDFVGSPLSGKTSAELVQLSASSPKVQVSTKVQQLLDPYCVAVVTIKKDSTVQVKASPKAPPLVEQGWRTFLVKVVNRAGAETALRVTSPNAGSVPGTPQAQVGAKWLDLSLFNGRPLQPTLSGLELEYRMIQLYSRDAGRRQAKLLFNVGEWDKGAKRKPLIKRWTFDEGTNGWKAQNHIELKAKDGQLEVTSTGRDPFMSAPVKAEEAPMVLRFWARFEKGGVGQVFWWTKKRPRADGAHRVNFLIKPGRFQEYSVPFSSDGELAAVRLDPGNAPGKIEIDWIELAYRDRPSSTSVPVDLSFECQPSNEIRFYVRDENAKPTVAAFLIRDEEGRVYPAQSKRLAPDFFFHPQIYRETGESIRLPDGKYTVICSRGPESIPEPMNLVVDGKPMTISYQVKRWIDPAKLGWYSGDHHIHAAGCRHYELPTEGVHPPDMIRHCRGEDLKVGCALTWGPCFDFQKQFFTGKVDTVSVFPYLLRYDIEVSGFGSHRSGHLCLLRLSNQMYPGGESKDHWPTLGLNTLKFAKRQGAITGPAHSAIGLTRFVGRLEGVEDGPGGLPNFNIPAYDGIGANEYVVDITHEVPGADGKPVPAVDFISTMDTQRQAEWNMWYHTLNCGFRVRASGETDFPCISGAKVGLGRVYVKVPGKLDYDAWCEGIRAGRSYVSDGSCHLMEFQAIDGSESGKTVEVGVAGSELKVDGKRRLRFRVQAAMRSTQRSEVPVELIVNSLPVQKKMIPADGSTKTLEFEVELEQSSWVAVRVFPHAHTNPIFVIVDGKPVRANKHSAEWLLRGVDECWKQKEKTYHKSELEDAKKAYEHARTVYRKIISEHAMN